jgi:stage II sporulation protein D
MKSKVNILLVVLLFISSCAPMVMPTRKYREEPTVRILLKKNPGSIEFTSDSKIKIKTGDKDGTVSGRVSLYFEPSLKIITPEGNIKNPELPISIESTKRFIRIDGEIYPGTIVISRFGDVLVVNHVKIEDYLKGVIPFEMGNLPESQIEALKAQAVAARSFVMAHLKPNEPFDISTTIWDQVYGGVSKTDKIINKAVESTRGIVAIYDGKIIDAKYSSTCGGITENNENIWIGERIPYLRSVRDSGWDRNDFCRFSPHYRWERTYDKKDFFEVIKKQIQEFFGKTPNRIEWIRITKRTRTNRVRTIEINTDTGKFYLEKDQIRRLFSDDRGSLKSLMFQIKVKSNQIIVSGKGYGHGVGMCQYGAMEMAKERYSYQKILSHYYKGIRLNKLW